MNEKVLLFNDASYALMHFPLLKLLLFVKSADLKVKF